MIRRLRRGEIRPEPVGTLGEQDAFYVEVSIRTAELERAMKHNPGRHIRADAGEKEKEAI